MSKSSTLPYDPPFRYKRPTEDLQAIFGAQIGNPPLVNVRKATVQKPSASAKKRPAAAANKTGTPRNPKTSLAAGAKRAASAKAKPAAKKTAARR